jgi:hypothetical protein
MARTETEAEKKTEDFMTSKWRPMMAMTYMATIIFDFILGPILFNILQYYNPGQAVTSWTPLTLQGGGLYHLAMGAILGISALTRGQEKVAQINASAGENKSFSSGFEGTPVASPSAQPQWVNTPPPTQGYKTEQSWAQPTAPTPAPVATDFGSAPPPAFGDTPIQQPVVVDETINQTVINDDPDRPLRRVKK